MFQISFSIIPLFFPNITQGLWEWVGGKSCCLLKGISERDSLHFFPSPFLWLFESLQVSRQNFEDMRACKKRHSADDKPKQARHGHHLGSPLPTHMCHVVAEGRAQALRLCRSVLEGKHSDGGPSRRAACPLVFLLVLYCLLFSKSWVRTRGHIRVS